MLDTHLNSGAIYIDNDTYIGVAQDNTHVIIGQVGHEDEIELYLIDYPVPSTW